MTFLELFKQDVAIAKNIPFGLEGEERLTLDIYAPPNAHGLPVTMWFYGGGWRSGDKRLFEHLGRAFAVRGIVAVAANYRLTPEVKYPTNAEDCAAATAWVYRNIGRYGGNPEALFVAGHSAGAHLAAMIALDERFLEREGLSNSIIRGVVMVSGAADLAEYVHSSVFTAREHIEETFGRDEVALRAASPINWVSSDDPPFLVITAENDPPGLRKQGKALAEALRNVDVLARYISVRGRDHFSIVRRFGSGDDTTANSAAEFIQRLTLRT
ncbi:MAG: alpha/beta hydrolase [Ignavibacteriae bacterium]|nr:alpha/beta hydrolase [Ignavibacteriota bacterium]MCB9217264.1 alpha/beta hydrolase [Ignavibacteria bacterium]